MERKSLKELSQLYDSGKVTTLQYIRSLEARVRQANGMRVETHRTHHVEVEP